MKMALRILFLLVLGINCTTAYSQNIDSLFASVPRSVLPLLDHTAKLDLLDLYNNKLTARAENVYGGQTTLIKKTQDYLRLQLTESSTWEMKIVPQNMRDTFLVCIHSVDALGVSSNISVYHTNWQTAKLKYEVPSFSDFLIQNEALSYSRRQNILRMLSHAPISASLNDTTQLVTFQIALNALGNEWKEDAKKIISPVHYQWKDEKWQKAD